MMPLTLKTNWYRSKTISCSENLSNSSLLNQTKKIRP